MKVVYIAGRWDPRQQDEYSGNDYGAYHAIEKQLGVDLSLVGPMDFQPSCIEKGLTKVYNRFTGKRLFKYSLTYPKKSAMLIEKEMELKS